MFTLNQLEALVWVVRLGGFSQAASRLRTTQSAVSKRVGELEERLGTRLFDRSTRTAHLTEKGRELFLLGEGLLEHHHRVVEQVARPDVVTRHLRLGFTELTALTWLPQFIGEVSRNYPKVSIEQEIKNSVSLFDGLAEDRFDVIVSTDIPDRRQVFRRETIGQVENVWMCSPGLIKDYVPKTGSDLSRFNILVQGEHSGTWVQYESWLRAQQIDRRQIRYCSDLIAQIGFTLSGLGVSYLPLQALSHLVRAGRLSILDISPSLSPVQYVAASRLDRASTLHEAVLSMAKACCNFSKLVLDLSEPT